MLSWPPPLPWGIDPRWAASECDCLSWWTCGVWLGPLTPRHCRSLCPLCTHLCPSCSLRLSPCIPHRLPPTPPGFSLSCHQTVLAKLTHLPMVLTQIIFWVWFSKNLWAAATTELALGEGWNWSFISTFNFEKVTHACNLKIQPVQKVYN